MIDDSEFNSGKAERKKIMVLIEDNLFEDLIKDPLFKKLINLNFINSKKDQLDLVSDLSENLSEAATEYAIRTHF